MKRHSFFLFFRRKENFLKEEKQIEKYEKNLKYRYCYLQQQKKWNLMFH
jgi:hypothetical protein